MPSLNITNACKIAVNLLPDLPVRALGNNGGTIYIREAFLSNILLENLFVNCQLIPFSFNNSTTADMVSMVWRSEVDFVLLPTAVTEEITKYIDYSYPVQISPISFLTDKPDQLSNTSAVLEPFSYGLWIFLVTFLFIVALLYYVLAAKQVKLQKVLFNIFGNVLQQQSLRFALKKNSVRWLLFAWLLGIMVLGSSYKAALLSFLLAPTEFVIRDIPQLAKEANKHSVKCVAPNHNYYVYKTVLLESDIESWKAVGACLERNRNETAGKNFYSLPPKKAHLVDMSHKEYFKYRYFVSDDYFFVYLYGYMYSKKFLLADRLNDILLRVQAAGLFEKYYRDEAFFEALSRNQQGTPPSTTSDPISLDSLNGAFILLMFGWGVAVITLLTEMVYYKRKINVLTNT